MTGETPKDSEKTTQTKCEPEKHDWEFYDNFPGYEIFESVFEMSFVVGRALRLPSLMSVFSRKFVIHQMPTGAVGLQYLTLKTRSECRMCRKRKFVDQKTGAESYE